MKWKSYRNPPESEERPGDKGQAKLLDGTMRPKTDPVFIALNHIWELNTAIGILAALTRNNDLEKLLKTVQHHLFIIQAELASVYKKESDAPKLDFKKTKWLEGHIKKIAPHLPDIKSFILPGGSINGSILDWLGALTRKTESIVYKVHEKQKVNPPILHYINRLSDFFYILARSENYKAGTKEQKPKYE